MQNTQQGFTLGQLLITMAIAAILAAIAIPSYLHHIQNGNLQRAHAALLENAHFMERFYQQNRTFKQTSTTWPELPVSETNAFCIRVQGKAQGAHDNQFTLKAVALDKNDEPRILKINESLITMVCEDSISSCKDGENVFSGNDSTDKSCSVFK
ncbi:pilin [Neisseria animaloris]|uniref:type IV pilin protein n=1 Tax=Neisseria animaloris TaxID=326522 RepID=UPI000A18BFC6|nr:type IV pilin protein [Neisseria animaloris]OSI08866.1 pilin [Neisseria animaloris]VEH87160.1 pilin [Neisseria animaloris]